MNKYLKWFIIGFLSLFLLLTIVIGGTMWYVFTPEKLTPLVREQAGKYISCPTEIGEVELTFFSTFPSFGIKVKDLALINPVDNAPADTLLRAGEFIGKVDLASWWNRGDLMITELQLKNGTVNAFVDSLGRTNFDILRGDSIAAAVDTTSSEMPFHFVNMEQVAFENIDLSYIDLSQKLDATIRQLNAQFSGSFGLDTLRTQMNVNDGTISLNFEGENYLQDVSVRLSALAQMNLANQSVAFRDAEVSVNEMDIAFGGTLENDTLHKRIVTDIQYKTNLLSIPALLALVPPSFQSYLKGSSQKCVPEGKKAVTL